MIIKPTLAVIALVALAATAPMALAKGHDQGAGSPAGGPSAGAPGNENPGGDAAGTTAATAKVALGTNLADAIKGSGFSDAARANAPGQ